MNEFFILKQNIFISIKNFNSIPKQPIIANNTEFIETNSTKNEYLDRKFNSGFSTILVQQVKEVKYVFDGVGDSGLFICTILNGDNVKIIDREIIENSKIYKVYKIKHHYTIQPAGTIISSKFSLV